MSEWNVSKVFQCLVATGTAEQERTAIHGDEGFYEMLQDCDCTQQHVDQNAYKATIPRSYRFLISVSVAHMKVPLFLKATIFDVL